MAVERMTGECQPVQLLIPRLTANDDRIDLIEWLVEEGSEVWAGEVVCVVETTKSLQEIPSPASGVIGRLASVGKEYSVGESIAEIYPIS